MSTDDEDTMTKALALAIEVVKALPRWCGKSDLLPMMRLLEERIGRSLAALYREAAAARLAELREDEMAATISSEAL